MDLKGVWGSLCCSSVRLCGPLDLTGADTHPALGNWSLAAAFCSPHGGVCELVHTSTAAADYRAASCPAQDWTVRQDTFPGWLKGCTEDSTSSYLLEGIPTYQRTWRAAGDKCASICKQLNFIKIAFWVYTVPPDLLQPVMKMSKMNI